MRVIYEALVMVDYDGSYYAFLPDLPACAVQADSYENALYLLADYSEETLSQMLCEGMQLPTPSYGRIGDATYSVATLVLSASDEANYRVMSALQAADTLGVSQARVSQMLKDGTLQGYKTGRDSWVYVTSVEDRLRYYPNPRTSEYGENAGQ